MMSYFDGDDGGGSKVFEMRFILKVMMDKSVVWDWFVVMKE